MFNFFKKNKSANKVSNNKTGGKLTETATNNAKEILLQNSLSSKKEVFEPVSPGELKMYNCGPTVYSKIHIGNLRSYVFADLLKRLFEYNNYTVNQVINITDVGHLTSDADTGEDKLEKAAKEQGEKAAAIATKYTDLFMKDLEALNIETQKIKFTKATDHIAEQIAMIETLEKKGLTYKISDGIYYDTSKFKDYGQLGNIGGTDSETESRIGENSEKKNSADFALWKFSKPEEAREQEWDSPWGVGFPGWHIECSAMSAKYLGETFDIHTGGVDHLQIHHNNEIAQSQAVHEKPQANYWLHNNHITLNGERIAKSTGHTVYLSELEDKVLSPISYRYWLLTSHYSTLSNFTEEALVASDKAFKKLLGRFSDTASDGQISETYSSKIRAALNDDLNTPQALATIWEMLKDNSISKENQLATILEADKVLGLNIDKLRKEISDDTLTEEIPENIQKLAKERDAARKNKNFRKADEIRGEIESLGYEIIDSGDTYSIEKI
jgi:cysteinyl-tRNA synthetase